VTEAQPARPVIYMARLQSRSGADIHALRAILKALLPVWLEMRLNRAGAASMNLSYRAYQLRCEIQRILAETPPSEGPGRIEDVVHDALDEPGANVRREFTET